MAALINRTIAIFASSICLASCSSSMVKVTRGVLPDRVHCLPHSTAADELAKSQSACHHGIPGNGIQVLLSTTARSLSIHSDTTQQELTSIFVHPLETVETSSSVKFDAFYSKGLAELTGKTGCVGIFKEGFAHIERKKAKTVLNYHLKFKLVSPLGWRQDCQEHYQTSGTLELK